MSRIAFRNFTGGEVTPTLSARYDLQKFGTFLRHCENFVPNLHGDIERRPGTVFLNELPGPCVMQPFQFNTDPENNYALLFCGSAYILITVVLDQAKSSAVTVTVNVEGVQHAVVVAANATEAVLEMLNPTDKAPCNVNVSVVSVSASGVSASIDVSSPARIYVADENGLISGAELANPYTNAEAYELSTAQAADVLYVAHREHPLRKITRSGTAPSYTWAIINVEINKSIDPPTWPPNSADPPPIAWHDGSDSSSAADKVYKLRYVVTAIDANGVESVASSVKSVKGRYPTDWIVGDYVSLRWNAVQGAAEYNIYRDSAGYYGFIGTTSGTTFQDQNYEPDTATTPKKNWDPFAGGNYPAAVTFHQQRLVLGGGKKSPNTFYASRVGDFENFRKSSPTQDDDALEYMIASGSIDDIKWMASFGDLVVGTSGAEYKVSSAGASISPSDVQITTQSYWGSSGLQPMIIGNSVMHAQRADTHVRDLYYSWEKDGYSGNDLSLLAPQLVETHKLKQWCFQQSPGSNLWMVREDGALLCLTYMQEQKVYGWSRHVTDGSVLSVCGLCGAQSDEAFFVVKRTHGGTDRYFLERLAMRFRDEDGIADAFYVDCGTTVEPVNDANGRKVVVNGLSHLEGRTVSVLADGSPEEGHVVAGGSITLHYPADKATVGLPYASVLCPMPVETDMEGGSTLGKKRGYGKCILRLYRSVGGTYAATERGDLFDRDAWQTREFYRLPFIPETFGEACAPFSGDIEISLPSGQDNDTSIWLKQDKPLPFRLVAVAADVDFGER